MTRAFGLLVAVALLLVAGLAGAHRVGTAILDIVEVEPGRATAWYLLPGASGEALPVFPARCRVADAAPRVAARSQLAREVLLECPGGLRGAEVGVDRLGLSVRSVMLRVRLIDGTEHAAVLTPAHPTFRIPLEDDAWAAFPAFVMLGIEHILSGVDHLLFVVGVLWLARLPRRIVTTVTAFTLAHSLTLVATVLGWVAVSSDAAEACIAVSLVLVALDLGREAPDRHPEAIAFGFGLVHGLGFAGALAEIGLPAESLWAALAAFNLGVELGQLAFVAACLGIGWAAIRCWPARREWLTDRAVLASAYLIGSVGAFFALQRVSRIVAPFL